MRTAAEIARGLEPSRRARPILPGTRIHVVGAAGAAASGALLLADAAGAVVSGCDTGGESPYGVALAASGIAVAAVHERSHVIDAAGRPLVDVLAVSKAITSVDPDHVELRAAHAAGLPAISCQQLIADAIATRSATLVAASGTHGKSTTTGWLVHLLALGGLDPSAFCGALMPAELTGDGPSVVRLGAGPAFVVEADEYAGNFDPYRPQVGVVLNADWDHPDVFADRTAVVDAFEGWIRRFEGHAGEPPTLVANAGDRGVAALLDRLIDWPGRLVTVRVSGPGDGDPATARRDLLTGFRTALGPPEALTAAYRAGPQGEAELALCGLPADFDDRDRNVRLRLVGRHYAEDALAAAAAALVCGVAPAVVLAGLESYAGVGRRFELKGEAGGVAVLDDFGHHPTAIAATLEAARLRYPGRRLWAVYEPLTFHRTARMLEAFADVLATADRVAIADIYAVRDPDRTIVAPGDLASAIARRGVPAEAPGSVEATADWLHGQVQPGDVVLVMGGGRSHVIAERLAALLADADTA
ncbi:MAG TPA: cyanophycin synthetase [Candidatus Limnocylindrales bacterium]|nr:cyanophycin synthetase [Candidatus Limnocylindrales bacterium]